MRVSEVLIQALEELDAANVPGDLRPVAFQVAVELLGRDFRQQPARTASGQAAELHGGNASGVDVLAQKLQLAPDVVQEVYNLNDGNLEVVVGVGKLESNSSAATKQLALLVAGGRQLAGLEEWTPIEAVRSAAEQFGRYDGPNFARTLKQLDDVFSFRGKGRSREVKLNRVGLERLLQLVRSLTGTRD